MIRMGSLMPFMTPSAHADQRHYSADATCPNVPPFTEGLRRPEESKKGIVEMTAGFIVVLQWLRRSSATPALRTRWQRRQQR